MWQTASLSIASRPSGPFDTPVRIAFSSKRAVARVHCARTSLCLPTQSRSQLSSCFSVISRRPSSVLSEKSDDGGGYVTMLTCDEEEWEDSRCSSDWLGAGPTASPLASSLLAPLLLTSSSSPSSAMPSMRCRVCFSALLEVEADWLCPPLSALKDTAGLGVAGLWDSRTLICLFSSSSSLSQSSSSSSSSSCSPSAFFSPVLSAGG